MSDEFSSTEGRKPADGFDRRKSELANSILVSQELRFSIPTDRRFVGPVVTMLKEFCERMGLVSEREQMRIGVALEEALVNAIVHGNLEVSSKLRELDDGSFERLIAFRVEKPPYRDRRVEVVANYSKLEATFRIRDEGPGFDVSKVPDPTDENYTCRPHGRGIFLMRSFMDEVTHNEIGNQVILKKRKTSPETQLPENSGLEHHAISQN